ncbi:hypothetical protein [Streptomyces sp. PBH53]|uniref:hypothetical protein n=1 Tax=Streptomyces sp. PBH53 TaxID=1577075 RepID=UPI001AD81432|nr:hypothetical protein [Streptomyces sp. PBH53]
MPVLPLEDARPAAAGGTPPVPGAPRPAGRFERTGVNRAGLRAVPVDTAEGLPVRLVRR